MNLSRRSLIGICAAALVALNAAPGNAETVLRVAAYPANPPWQFKDENGNFKGFEVDIVNEIARRMNAKAEIEGLDFKALFVASASNRVDMVISSLTITNERLESQAFTQPYVVGALGLAVKKGSDVKQVADLKGKVAGSIATSFPENWLKERAAELGYSEYKSYDTLANMLTDLRNGRVDGVVNDVVGLRYATIQMDDLDVVEEIVTGEKFAMMMPKGSKLIEQVNTIISDMKKDGTMAGLYKTWFGVEPAADSLTLTPLPVPTSAD